MTKLSVELKALLAKVESGSISDNEFEARFLVTAGRIRRRVSRDPEAAPRPCRMGCARKTKPNIRHTGAIHG